MNPLMILGGLGILGVVLMGFKKKTTQSPAPYIPSYPGTPYDPNEPPAWGPFVPLLPGVQPLPYYPGPDVATPDWIREQEEADSGMFRHAIPGRLA